MFPLCFTGNVSPGGVYFLEKCFLYKDLLEMCFLERFAFRKSLYKGVNPGEVHPGGVIYGVVFPRGVLSGGMHPGSVLPVVMRPGSVLPAGVLSGGMLL